MTRRHVFRAGLAGLATFGSARGQQGEPAGGAKPAHRESSIIPAEQWARLPHLDWSNIVLTNHVDLAGSRTLTGGRGFLMKVPTGQTLAVSEWFTTGAVDVLDPKGAIRSWYMCPPGSPANRARVGDELVPGDLCRATGGMLQPVLDPPPPGTVQILTPAEGPPPIRKRGYLVVMPDESAPDGGTAPGPVTIYGVQIVGPDSHHRPGVFCIGFFSKADPASFRGGVVLDHQCHVLGLQTNYYPEGCHDGAIVCQAVDVHALLDAAKLPTESPPAAAVPPDGGRPVTADPPPTTAPAGPAAALPAAIDDSAAKALRLARMYEASSQYATARNRLQQLIIRYPNTPAAEQARADLRQIQGK